MSILLENLSGIGKFIETHNSDSGRNKNPKSSMYKYITELKSIVQKHPTGKLNIQMTSLMNFSEYLRKKEY